MMESGSCISTATFIQIITKSPSPQFAGWGISNRSGCLGDFCKYKLYIIYKDIILRS